jgi:hypothetical protein
MSHYAERDRRRPRSAARAHAVTNTAPAVTEWLESRDLGDRARLDPELTGRAAPNDPLRRIRTVLMRGRAENSKL